MKKVLNYYVSVIMFLFPVFVLPIVSGAYGFGKNWFWGAAGLVGLLVWAAGVVSNKRPFKKSRVLVFVAVFALWSLVSWLRLPAGVQMRSLMNPMGLGTVLTVLVWVFLWVQVAERKEFGRQFVFLSAAGLVVALTALVVFVLPESKFPLGLPKENSWITLNAVWSLTGSLQTEVILFLFLVFEWVRRLVRKLGLAERGKGEAGYMVEAAAVVFFGLMLLLDVYRIYKYGWLALDLSSSWVIAVESLKRTPVFGVGIGNFLQAFNSYRPVSYNLTKYWSSSFGASGMAFLQIWTELGIGGLVLVFLMIKGWLAKRKVFRGARKIEFWRMGLFLALCLCLPMNLMTVFLLVWLVSVRVFEVDEGQGIGGWQLRRTGGGEFDATMGLKIGLAVVLVGLVGFVGYWWGRILLGEVYLRRSFVAMAKNDGGGAYDWQIKAIGANLRAAEYRRFYSQTNLSLSRVVLANEDVGEEDRQKAAVLIQQAAREAKAAVTLDSRNVAYWVNLALTYRGLVGTVEGAADWSLEAYQQSVALDPVNPLLRLELGGLLYAGGRYEEADRVFEQVVVNKGDFANGWYNWAYSAKKMNKLADAVARLSQAVALVPVDSGDYDKADGELTGWKKELEEAIAKAKVTEEADKPAETLAVPEPLPTVVSPVEVKDEGLEPPEAVVSPVEEEELMPTE